MCGRYSQSKSVGDLMIRFQFKKPSFSLSPRYNLAPGQDAPIVLMKGPARMLEMMHWGLIPHWAKEKAIGYKMINARAETVAEKPSYRKALKSQRCLVVADGFYEWQTVPGIKKKIPQRIALKTREPFAMAGLWDSWKEGQEEIHSFTIITTEPNSVMKPIHNRMPVILQEKDEQMWLDPDLNDPAKLLPLLAPYSNPLETYPVSMLVNSPGNDTAECVKPM